MRTVIDLWEGGVQQETRIGPVIDLEREPGVQAVTLELRAIHGELTDAVIEATTWDVIDRDSWETLASVHVGQRGEETITAECRPELELVRYRIKSVLGRGPFYAAFSTKEEK